MHYVIYDGHCNLCSNLVQLLEQVDRGERFQYTPMQNRSALQEWGITPADCEMGMILIDAAHPQQRWQGSAAAEEIGRLLPLGHPFVAFYRAIPGLQWSGDRLYAHVRDHRYRLFGTRSSTYQSQYPVCDSGACQGQDSA